MKTPELAVALVMLILAWSTAVIAAELESQSDRPNIVFVLIDDLGWNGIASYGNKLVKTPHIDKLASEGGLACGLALRPATQFLALLQCLCGLQHSFDMPWHLHPAPFLPQHAVSVDEEGASVYAEIFLAVELFQLDHVEQLAKPFVLVADQLEREALLGLEVFVGFETVSRYAEHDRIGRDESIVLVAKALALGGAARSVVLRVEVQDHLLALQRLEADLCIAGGLCLEGWRRLVNGNRHSGFPSQGF